MEPFHHDETFHSYKGNLPHWNQEGATYFITLRLADSIPEAAMKDWTARREVWILYHGLDTETFSTEQLSEEAKKDYKQRFGKRFQELLDAGHGSCLLKVPENAMIVANALEFFHGDRYLLGSFVVKPNHVHMLITPADGHKLFRIMQSLRRYTAREINKRDNRHGQLWQFESYDHIVRNERQLATYVRYIQENPEKANLRPGEYLLKS